MVIFLANCHCYAPITLVHAFLTLFWLAKTYFRDFGISSAYFGNLRPISTYFGTLRVISENLSRLRAISNYFGTLRTSSAYFGSLWASSAYFGSLRTSSAYFGSFGLFPGTSPTFGLVPLTRTSLRTVTPGSSFTLFILDSFNSFSAPLPPVEVFYAFIFSFALLLLVHGSHFTYSPSLSAPIRFVYTTSLTFNIAIHCLLFEVLKCQNQTLIFFVHHSYTINKQY